MPKRFSIGAYVHTRLPSLFGIFFVLLVSLITSGCHRAHADETPAPASPSNPESPLPETPSPNVRQVILVATGDLLIHQRVARAGELHSSEGGFAWTLAGLAQSIGQDEIAYLNLETPLSRSFRDVSSTMPPVLGAPPEVASALAGAGIDIVGVANNHAYDQGAAGFRATLQAAREAGVVTAGGGAEESEAYAPVFLDRSGVRVAFIAATDRLNASPERWDPTVRVARTQQDARLTASITHARAQADLVVLAVHWGEEFATSPTRAQRAAARRWLDLGVDVLLGTGPHVLLPVERAETPRGEGVIAYSLGNAISNQGLKYVPGRAPPGLEGAHEESPLPRDSVLLRIRIEFPAPGAIRITAVSGEPLWTENNWRRRWIDRTEIVQIRRLRDCDETIRQDRFDAIAHALGAEVSLAR